MSKTSAARCTAASLTRLGHARFALKPGVLFSVFRLQVVDGHDIIETRSHTILRIRRRFYPRAQPKHRDTHPCYNDLLK